MIVYIKLKLQKYIKLTQCKINMKIVCRLYASEVERLLNNQDIIWPIS